MNPTIVKIIDMMYRDIPKTEETDTLREELLTNCQARYEDLLAAGATPDDALGQVLDSLRGMEDVLDTFRTGAKPADQPRSAAAGERQPTVPTIDGGEYTPSFRSFADSAMESAGAAMESAMEAARAAMENAKASIQGVFDEKPQPTAPVTSVTVTPVTEGDASIYTFPARQIREVNMQLYGDDVELNVTQSGSLRVEIDNNEGGAIAVSEEGGVLTVQRVSGSSRVSGHMEFESSGEEGLGGFLARLGRGLSNLFNDNLGSHSVRLYIPHALEKLNLSTSSGDMDVNGLTITGDASLSSASGDVVMDRCTVGGSLRMNNTSGDCGLTLTAVGGELCMNSTSGDLYAGFETSAAAVRANTTSGDIEVFTQTGRVGINSVSGDIEAQICPGLTQFSANTTSGDIEVCVPDGMAVAVAANTTSGDVEISCHSDPSAPVRLTLNTVSGDIDVSC